ncbi:MAG TPA: GatB/YqeY domain-containing protein [Rhodospirillales bacterium]|nr:GatB/YqeY domain-containing protein [Rhodospirillales bacterium]
MIRDRLGEALKASMKAKKPKAVSTLRLILAALKDRDIAARPKGNLDGISEDEILGMLQSMIKQRRESISLYEKGGRLELAEGEAAEIATIEEFLPEQMGEEEMFDTITSLIVEIEAQNLKDMGRTMAALKERFAGRMDFAKASQIVKGQLGN